MGENKPCLGHCPSTHSAAGRALHTSAARCSSAAGEEGVKRGQEGRESWGCPAPSSSSDYWRPSASGLTRGPSIGGLQGALPFPPCPPSPGLMAAALPLQKQDAGGCCAQCFQHSSCPLSPQSSPILPTSPGALLLQMLLTPRPVLLQTFNTNQPPSPLWSIVPVPPEATGKLSTNRPTLPSSFSSSSLLWCQLHPQGATATLERGRTAPPSQELPSACGRTQEMSQGARRAPPQPPSSSTHGAWVAVPTQLRRAPGRQHVPVGLSCPTCGSGAVMGQKSGSAGHRLGQGRGVTPQLCYGYESPTHSPHLPPGSGVGAGLSCSVPTKPLQKSDGSARSRATTCTGGGTEAGGAGGTRGSTCSLCSAHLALPRRVLHDDERRGVGRAVPNQRGAEDTGQVEDVHLAAGAARHPARGRGGHGAWLEGAHLYAGGGLESCSPHLSRCSMRKASVSLLAAGSLPTTCRRAVLQAASSGMSVEAVGVTGAQRSPPHLNPHAAAHQRPAGRPGADRR